MGKERPGALSHHTSVVLHDKMYLFGGSGPRTPNADSHALWALDLKTLRWEAVSPRGDLPQTRDEHTAVIYEHS